MPVALCKKISLRAKKRQAVLQPPQFNDCIQGKDAPEIWKLHMASGVLGEAMLERKGLRTP
jgi:hypothetical protein